MGTLCCNEQAIRMYDYESNIVEYEIGKSFLPLSVCIRQISNFFPLFLHFCFFNVNQSEECEIDSKKPRNSELKTMRSIGIDFMAVWGFTIKKSKMARSLLAIAPYWWLIRNLGRTFRCFTRIIWTHRSRFCPRLRLICLSIGEFGQVQLTTARTVSHWRFVSRKNYTICA